jgi:ubiquitin carboxyl-terminal hydrolase 7
VWSMRSLRLLLLASVARGAYLGLRNQGNTCYMNSFLQTLHHSPEFRDAIYAIPTIANASASSTVPFEMQRLFYLLEHAENAGTAEVGTERLTRSFGWGRREVMVQQDVQEFARMLCDALQDSMLAAGVHDGIADLFEGKTSSVTRCTRVDFVSEKEERFYDLQMQVQGCGSLQASLRHFVHEERLTGDNKYNTRDPKLGKQDARRGVRFKRLPPVLQLHLKRFEYDAASGSMHKLQQAFRFPRRLCLHRFMAKDAPDQPPPDYELHAVVSHVGEVGSGHYVAYVRPRGSRQWYEFDDTRVSAVAEDVAIRQQFGGRHGQRRGGMLGMGGHSPNAYMLVYVRKDVQSTETSHSDQLLDSKVRKSFERELHRGSASATEALGSLFD